MTKIGDLVKQKRTKRGLGLRQLADKAGVSPATVSKIEAGDRPQPEPDTLERIARALGEDASMFYEADGYSDSFRNMKYESSPSLPAGAIPLGPLVSLPYYDEIYGDPIEMQQLPDGFAVVDTNFLSDDLDKYFWLNVKDDSMIDDLRPGSRILVHRGKDIRDGDFAVVAINKAAAIVRTVQHAGQMLVLVPKNSAYEMKTVTNEEANVVGWVEGSFIPMKRPGA
jgi:SOS-response transcriptional repressor LexA